MNHLIFRYQRIIARNQWSIALISLINVYVLINFIQNDSILHGIGYFIFFYISIVLIDLFASKYVDPISIPIKNKKKEVLLALIFVSIGILALALNFYANSLDPTPDFLVRLPILIMILFCTFPLGIALYLLKKKYKLIELGIKFKPWIILLLGIAIWGLTGLFSLLFNYEGIIWEKGYQEFGGVIGIIIQGIIGAALVEEFWRFILQTRLNFWVSNTIMSIILASLIWAVMHVPVWYFRGSSFQVMVHSSLQIVPIGFVWGFLTHRTKSIIPSVLAHGLNLWGFQNG